MRIRKSDLADHADFFNGKAPAEQRDFGPFPIFGSNGRIGYSEEFNHENGIILGRVGAYCGSVEICQGKFWASDNTIVVKPRGENDLIYLYYRLKSAPLRSFAGGSAQPLLTHGILRNVRLLFANEEVQPNISQVVKSYDDLIANNRRRIELLERSARLLFKEWFVWLRYPGHEHDKIVDGIPDGWERKALGEIITLHYGKALKEETRESGEIEVYGSSGEVGKHNVKLVDGPGIVVGRKGNVGSVFWVDEAFWPIDTVFYVGSELVSLFILHLLQAQTFQNSDAAVPGLNRDYAYGKKIIWPEQSMREKFESFAETIFAQRKLLLKANVKLAIARDLLLPRLMDGRIPI